MIKIIIRIMMGWIKRPQGIIFMWERNGDGAPAL